jgi:multiple antibiotic resistance protein
MEHFFTSAGVAVAALFPVVDPIGVVPWFLGVTRDLSSDERRSEAAKAALISVAMLTLFLFFGHFVLDFFEVSLAAVEFVGGLVIGWVGWEMLTQPLKTAYEKEVASENGREIFFSPLAFPLLAGPGALAITLGLSNRHDNWLDYPGFVVGIVVVLALAYLILTRADWLLRRLGPHGIDVFNRIMGLIVLAIAAELVFHGISDHFGLTVVE